jgi:hypothetical protein
MRARCRPFSIARLAFAILGVAWAPHAVGGEFVVVSATAAPGYKRTKGPDGIMGESYVFTPGIHFGGALRNTTLEKLPFLTVAQMLAPSLARQKYFPAKDPALANLAIVVHWGATQVYDNPNPQADIEAVNAELSAYRSAIQESGAASSGALNGAIANQETAGSQQQRYLNANAELLGYKRTLEKEGKRMWSSEDEITMRSELVEERYFVVLMAYDYQLMKKEKTPRLLWVTRMSIRSPGNNFAESVPGMARVAAEFFGQQRDEITRVETKLREGKVDIGELKIVGPPPDPAPPPKSP